MEQYIKIMNEDDDKDTVSQVCSSIVEVIKSVTYDSVEKCKRELITSSLLSDLFFSNTQKRPSTIIIILGFNKKSQESSSHVCMCVTVMVLLCLLAKWVILIFFGFFFGAFFVSGYSLFE